MKRTLEITVYFLCLAQSLQNSNPKYCFIYTSTTLCIKNTDFNDITKRNNLEITESNGSFEDGDFMTLPNVKTLSFQSSNITRIDPGFFNKFPNLEKLSIIGNSKFPNITQDLLKNCRNLETLKIIFNMGIRRIEEDTLRNFPYLEKLVIRSERIQHLTKYHMENLRYLRVLKIDLTTLKVIDNNAFEHLYLLEKLSLMANNFLTIKPEYFDNLLNLKHLNLIYSNLENVDFLVKLRKLEQVLLAGNSKLISFSGDTFKGLKHLTFIDLSYTGVKHLEVNGIMKQVPRLRKIDLTCHNLTKELSSFSELADYGVYIRDEHAGLFNKTNYC